MHLIHCNDVTDNNNDNDNDNDNNNNNNNDYDDIPPLLSICNQL